MSIRLTCLAIAAVGLACLAGWSQAGNLEAQTEGALETECLDLENQISQTEANLRDKSEAYGLLFANSQSALNLIRQNLNYMHEDNSEVILISVRLTYSQTSLKARFNQALDDYRNDLIALRKVDCLTEHQAFQRRLSSIYTSQGSSHARLLDVLQDIEKFIQRDLDDFFKDLEENLQNLEENKPEIGL